MVNFWDFSSWGAFNLIAVLLSGLLVANMLKRSIPWLEASLIPTSVLGGGILLLASVIYKRITGTEMFNTPFFGGNGTVWLELITYHMLALGFTASALRSNDGKMTKERSVEIFNTGLTMNLSLIFNCYAWICLEGEEKMERKPSRFKLINKINAYQDKIEDRLVERKREQKRQKTEKKEK